MAGWYESNRVGRGGYGGAAAASLLTGTVTASPNALEEGEQVPGRARKRSLSSNAGEIPGGAARPPVGSPPGSGETPPAFDSLKGGSSNVGSSCYTRTADNAASAVAAATPFSLP